MATNNDWWNNFLHSISGSTPASPRGIGPKITPYVPPASPSPVVKTDTVHAAGERDMSPYVPAAPRQQRGADGLLYYVDDNGNPTGLVPGQTPAGAGRTPVAIPTGGVGGPTWYEQQQVTLDKQRLADAEAQQKAAQMIADSNAVEKFNTDYRDFQAKSPYGAQYGPTYFSPAGAVFAQRAPESAVLKQAFTDTGQADPWTTGNTPAGYTGVTYSNSQHPGLVDWGHPSVQQNMPQVPGATQSMTQPTINQFQQWHDLAHQLPQPSSQVSPQPQTQPIQMGGQVAQVPSFASGGVVPGTSGSPQVIVAHGGEEVNPTPQSVDGMGVGGDWLSNFNAWHDATHRQQGGVPFFQTAPASTANAYGQTVGANIIHGAGEDVLSAPIGYSPESQKYLNNHVQYGPELTGLSGSGALITPNGTPVVMSNWQKNQFDPTSLANYGDYAHAIAGWNPADLAQYGNRMTGDMNDLNRPTQWLPIGIQPSPSGG